MKRTAFICFCAACLALPASLSAQEINESEMASRLSEMIEQQATRLADDFELKDTARTAFIENYRNYRLEQLSYQTMPQQNNRRNLDELTDEEASQMLTEAFDDKAQQIVNSYNVLEVDKKYLDIFAQTLTAKQLVRIFVQQQQQMGPNGRQGQGGRQGGQGGRPGGRGGNSNNGNSGFGGGNMGGDMDSDSNW